MFTGCSSRGEDDSQANRSQIEEAAVSEKLQEWGDAPDFAAAKLGGGEFRLSSLLERNANKLSGGERRRVEIARALTSDPRFLLLDEPFTGIDPITREELQEIVLVLKRKNIGILITDHNVRETLQITDRAYLMFDGKIILHGKADDLISNKKAKKLYLGTKFKL